MKFDLRLIFLFNEQFSSLLCKRTQHTHTYTHTSHCSQIGYISGTGWLESSVDLYH